MKFKKIIISAVLVLLLCCSFIMPAFAAPYDSDPAETSGASDGARAEQTQWYYRVRNGILEKRLWSITYGKWLTNWETA